MRATTTNGALVRGSVAVVAGIVLGLSAVGVRADEIEAPPGAHATSQHVEDAGAVEDGPVVSGDAAGAGKVVGIIGCLFGLAWVVGPVVRKEAPEEVPPAHSHDEPPGASGHHGPGGTKNPQPDAHGHH